jgi:hypothetical protein
VANKVRDLNSSRLQSIIQHKIHTILLEAEMELHNVPIHNEQTQLLVHFNSEPTSYVVVDVWGPESGCTAACRLILHTPCAFSVHTLTARRLHVLEILATKGETCWARNFR